MSYVTQGTIQVKKTVDPTAPKGKTEVFRAFITPVQDYHVKHRGNEYNILMAENNSQVVRACIAEEEYDVEDCVRDVLIGAASGRITVEAEIEVVPGKAGTTPPRDTYKIVAVKMPATVPKR